MMRWRNKGADQHAKPGIDVALLEEHANARRRSLLRRKNHLKKTSLLRNLELVPRQLTTPEANYDPAGPNYSTVRAY